MKSSASLTPFNTREFHLITKEHNHSPINVDQIYRSCGRIQSQQASDLSMPQNIRITFRTKLVQFDLQRF